MEDPNLETGTVVRTEGIWATVITNKSKSCRECGKAQAGICGKSGAGMIMKVKNFAGAEKGDTVELGLDRSTHFKAYFLAFVLPVIMLFLFTYAGHMLSLFSGVKNLDVIAGITGLILSVIFSFNRIRRLDSSTQLRITKILYDIPEYDTLPSPEEMDYLAAYGKTLK